MLWEITLSGDLVERHRDRAEEAVSGKEALDSLGAWGLLNRIIRGCRCTQAAQQRQGTQDCEDSIERVGN